ncbi:MAG: RNA polymerase sigma factor [Calditrichaeota bacterium]|nr:RNA polymerase sigma factor [Calditrichota bacterium]
MQLIIKGETRYLAELYRRYKQELFGFFYRMTSQAALSEDLVQNVFVRIIKYNQSYHGRGQFRSWLYQLARNVRADLSRGNQQRFQDQFEELSGDDFVSAESNEFNEELDLLDRAFLELNGEKRELLIMHRYQNFTYAQIAELINSNEGAIKVRIFRIICELREIYKKLESERA